MSAHSDEHPHVLPLKVYYGVGAILFILTAVTVLTGKYLHLDCLLHTLQEMKRRFLQIHYYFEHLK